jgi:hypothetical protein
MGSFFGDENLFPSFWLPALLADSDFQAFVEYNPEFTPVMVVLEGDGSPRVDSDDLEAFRLEREDKSGIFPRDGCLLESDF